MNREELGIASYGASVTTMEEVFLRWEKDMGECDGLSYQQDLTRGVTHLLLGTFSIKHQFKPMY